MNEEAVQEAQEALKHFVEEITPIIQEIINEVVRIAKKIAEVIAPALRKIASAIYDTAKYIVSQYPNRRVVWLALHHRWERVRKKNMRRIMQWYERRVLE